MRLIVAVKNYFEYWEPAGIVFLVCGILFLGYSWIVLLTKKYISSDDTSEIIVFSIFGVLALWLASQSAYKAKLREIEGLKFKIHCIKYEFGGREKELTEDDEKQIIEIQEDIRILESKMELL